MKFRSTARTGVQGAAFLLGLGLLAPRVASATQGAELYRTDAAFYGRFEARVRFAPGEGVVSSFFLWKDGSSSTTPWNELDFEKENSSCRLQTNIWTGMGTQSTQLNTPTFDICADYHTYAFEWTPDYISWVIDGAQVRKVTGASVNEYTQNASKGMAIHFNVWAGNSSFGGNLNASTLPVHQYVSWVQYSSYSNGAFQMKWREDFTGSSLPSGWATGDWSSPFNLSTHNPANVTFGNGVAALSMTADNATGYMGTPPADPMGGGTGSGGAAGTGGAMGSGGSGSGSGGAGAGTGGASGMSGSGGRGTGGGMATSGSGGMGMASGGAPGSGGSTGSSSGGTVGAGTGGVAAGTGGSGTGGGALASGGTVGSGGAAPTAGSGGAVATGGEMGSGGAPSGPGATPGDGGSGCGCAAAGQGQRGALGAFVGLLLVALAGRRGRRASRS